MCKNKIKIQIELIPKCSSLKEEFYHSIFYIVQQFACIKDARKIENLLDSSDVSEHGFIGDDTKIIVDSSINGNVHQFSIINKCEETPQIK